VIGGRSLGPAENSGKRPNDVEGGLFQILIFAGIAAVVFFRLFTVLGRKTGNERPAPPLVRAPEATDKADSSDNVLELPRRDAPEATALPAWGKDGPLGAGLTQIRLADPEFDLDSFLAGARAAFEMIIEAFHKGELEKVRSWLAPDVYRSFAAAVAERTGTNERTETELIAVNGCEATEAAMDGRTARVTVKFLSEQTEVVKDSEGRIVAGDLTRPEEVVDLWSFARDTRSRDPNWQLVATRSPD